MSALTSTSTDAEVWAAYDDNASYEEDASRAKALAFVTACRILSRRLPLAASRGDHSISRESLADEAGRAQAWLRANPPTSGTAAARVRFADLQEYRD